MRLNGILLALSAAPLLGGAALAASRAASRRGQTALWIVAAGTVLFAEVFCASLLAAHVFGSYEPTRMFIAALIVGVFVVSLAQRLPAQAAPADAVPLSRGVALVRAAVLAPAAALIGWLTWLSLRMPTYDWDGLGYHYVSTDHWVLSASLSDATQTPYSTGYARTGELLMAWPVAFTHSILGSRWVGILAAIVMASAAAHLARLLGAGPIGRAAAATMTLLAPIVMLQVTTGYVDLPGSAALMSAIVLLLEVDADHRWDARGAVLATVAAAGCAIAIGTRASFLPVLVLLVICVIAVYRRGFHRSAIVVGLLAGGASGYWYARAWVSHGNPTYPLRTGMFGTGTMNWRTVIDSQVPAELRASGSIWRVVRSWSTVGETLTYDQRLGGFGLAVAVGVVAVLVIGVRRIRRTQFAASLALVLVVAYAALSPGGWWTRYVMYVVPVGAAGLAVAASIVVRRWSSAWLRAAVAAALVAATAMGALPALAHSGSSYAGAIPGPSLATIAELSTGGEAGWYGPFTRGGWGNRLESLPDGAVIAGIDGSPPVFTHPFFGDHLQRTYVLLARPASVDELLAAMAAVGARYLVVPRDSPFEPVVADAAMLRPLIDVGREVLYRLPTTDDLRPAHEVVADLVAGGTTFAVVHGTTVPDVLTDELGDMRQLDPGPLNDVIATLRPGELLYVAYGSVEYVDLDRLGLSSSIVADLGRSGLVVGPAPNEGSP